MKELDIDAWPVGQTKAGWTGYLLDDVVAEIIDDHSVRGESGERYRSRYPMAPYYDVGDAIVVAEGKNGERYLTDPAIYLNKKP